MSSGSQEFWNRNPRGKNQHKECPPKDDPRVPVLLREYHRRNITNKNTISKLLLQEHGIVMSPATVVRRKKEIEGIEGSRATTAALPESEKRQLVFDQLAKRPTGNLGPRRVKELIALETSIHLTRDWIANEMRRQDPAGFERRRPQTKKKFRVPLVSLGPHHEWSGDGHDKLTRIGFPIYGIRDVWSVKWLGLWVVPNNRLKIVTAYLWLSLVKQLGGVPLQTTTDCGSETTAMYGFANALREVARPDLPVDELPAHRFLRSIENITIERGWRQLRLEWGDNIHVFWNAGKDLFNPNIEEEHNLVQWLWSSLIQRELDRLRDSFNNHKVRSDRNKLLPSGQSPNIVLALHTKYGGMNCLQPVDSELVEQLMEGLGGEDLIRFVPLEFEKRATRALHNLGMTLGDVSLENIWDVYTEVHDWL